MLTDSKLVLHLEIASRHFGIDLQVIGIETEFGQFWEDRKYSFNL